MDSLCGIVTSGKKLAAGFLSKRPYQVQIKQIIGVGVFPGTLNVQVNSGEREQFLSQIRGFEVLGFSDEETEFGRLRVFPILIENRFWGGIVIPEKTRYGPEIMEIVSDKNLRQQLNLKDGDTICIQENPNL